MLITISNIAEAQNFSAPKTFDASSYVTIPPIQTKMHSFNIDYVMCEHNYTAVHITTTVLTYKGGSINFPANTTIKPSSDDSKAYRIKSLLINQKKWSPGTPYYYYSNNTPKGSTIDIWLLFDRIPIDVEYIDYYDGGDRMWNNVPVVDNGNKLINTKIKKDDIMQLLAEKEPTSIEGIYEFVSCDNEKWWGKSSPCFGVLQQNAQEYRVIFLDDYNHCSPMWREGFLKATIRATAVENFYRVSWFIDDGSSMNDLHITFSEGVMSVKYPKLDAEALFVKMYPIAKSVKMQPSAPGGSSRIDRGDNTQNYKKEYKSQGSGVIISKDGMVVTNHHVIDGASEYDVVVKDGIGIYTYKADVVAIDKTNDLALLKINDKTFKPFTTIPYAINSKICSTGTQIYAMGYPISQYLGDEVKITDGIISSITGYQGNVTSYQISAAVQPGSSGGPVFDSEGNLIGITVAGVMSAQNVGYAIKSSYLCLFIESSPIRIEIPQNATLKGLSLTEQIKRLSKYVVSVNVK